MIPIILTRVERQDCSEVSPIIFRGESIYLGELSSEVGQLGVLGGLASRWSDLLQVEGWRYDLVDFLKHKQLDFSYLLPFRSPLPPRSKISL